MVGITEAEAANLAKYGLDKPRTTGVILELVEYPAGLGQPVDPATANPGTGHICFIVDDVDAIHARAVSAGYGSVNPPVTPTAGRWIGGRSVYLIDPDGVRVELVQLGPQATATDPRSRVARLSGRPDASTDRGRRHRLVGDTCAPASAGASP